MDTVVNRLIRYAKVFSESDYYGQSGTPSNPAEFDMANLLVEELHGLGIDNAFVDETCYVYATIPATPGCEHLPASASLPIWTPRRISPERTSSPRSFTMRAGISSSTRN